MISEPNSKDSLNSALDGQFPIKPSNAFWWGLFGSMLPEVLRLYKIAVAGQSQPTFHAYYIIISVIFVVCAGFFSVAWKPESSFKAIWVGASFPILVSTLVHNAPALSIP